MSEQIKEQILQHAIYSVTIIVTDIEALMFEAKRIFRAKYHKETTMQTSPLKSSSGIRWYNRREYYQDNSQVMKGYLRIDSVISKIDEVKSVADMIVKKYGQARGEIPQVKNQIFCPIFDVEESIKNSSV